MAKPAAPSRSRSAPPPTNRKSTAAARLASVRAAASIVSSSCARPRLPEYPTTSRSPESPHASRRPPEPSGAASTASSPQLWISAIRVACAPAATKVSLIRAPIATVAAEPRIDRVRSPVSARPDQPARNPMPEAAATSGNTSCIQLIWRAPRSHATNDSGIWSSGGSVLATRMSPRRKARNAAIIAVG